MQQVNANNRTIKPEHIVREMANGLNNLAMFELLTSPQTRKDVERIIEIVAGSSSFEETNAIEREGMMGTLHLLQGVYEHVHLLWDDIKPYTPDVSH